jgi:hypothetical protein
MVASSGEDATTGITQIVKMYLLLLVHGARVLMGLIIKKLSGRKIHFCVRFERIDIVGSGGDRSYMQNKAIN